MKAYPGTIEKVEYEIEDNGSSSHEFDIVNDKRVETKLEVDAASGKIIEMTIEEWEIGEEYDETRYSSAFDPTPPVPTGANPLFHASLCRNTRFDLPPSKSESLPCQLGNASRGPPKRVADNDRFNPKVTLCDSSYYRFAPWR